MRCFVRIAATFVLSMPPAALGCLAPPGDGGVEEQVAGEAVSADGCGPAAPPAYQPPSYPAPVYPAPSYPAPSYGAPQYAPPIYEAPRYSAPSQPPAVVAPAYAAPSYAAPIYLPPIYIGPIYVQIGAGAPAGAAPIAPGGCAGS